MGVCNNCGQQLDEGTLFCPYCGTKQEAPAPQESVAQEPVQPAAQEPVQPAAQEPVQPAAQEPVQQAPQQPVQQAQPQQQAVYPTYPEAQFQPGAAGQQGGYPQQNLTQDSGPQAAFGQPASQPAYTQPDYYAQPGGFPSQPMKAAGNGFLSKIPKPVLIIVPIVIALVLIFAIVSSNMRGASSYQGAVKNFFNAMDSGDTDDLYKAMFPKELEKAAKNELGSDLDYAFGMMGSMMGMIDIDKEHISEKEHASKSDISDFEDSINDTSNTKIKIQDMYYLTVEVEISMAGMSEEEEMDMTAYKVKGRWYVIPE